MGFPENHPLRIAHRQSTRNREALQASPMCHCFYCLASFPPSEIKRWIDKELTALCPKCGIDSVLPDSAVSSAEFLREMERHWFGELD